MAASRSQSPKLGKSTALTKIQATVTRLANLVPTLATDLSPVTVYQPGATVGGELTAGTSGLPNVAGTYGVWVAPDLNGNGTTYYVQVECFGAGGGGGGGNATQGGGGGAGGEYACETQYPIVPGNSYAYVVGLPGTGGSNNSTQTNPGAAGTNGGNTFFDLGGLGLAGGVLAHGGSGGDQNSVGIGGTGGSGSTNTIHFNGGAGGTNNSSNGSDNPISLAQASGMFVGNTLNPGIVQCWYIMNDSNFASGTRNDATFNGNTGQWTVFNGGFGSNNVNDAPAQVPAYASSPGQYGPNQTQLGWTSGFHIGTITQAAARFQSQSVFSFSGSKLTFSCWVQAPSAGTWGNNVNGTTALIAGNTQGYASNALKGWALFAVQNGTPSNPNWSLHWAVGNGSSRTQVVYSSFAPTPGSWYYIVGTFNSNLLTLYVNGSSQGTATAGYTSVPAGAFPATLGMDPGAYSNWFFGLVSNFWWATDCATSTLVSQAFGLTPATGGGGGGASGGPSAVGGAGASGSGATGGNGGTQPTQPASLSNTTSPAMGGYAGGAAGSGGSVITPGGGSYGGGGGGSGDMAANPALTVLTIPFTTAATYCGVDAQGGFAGQIYNVNQQNHPAGSLNSVLYAGGLAADLNSGSKNSMLLLPHGLAAQQLGNTLYTIENVFLTVTNAFPTNTVESILEIGYSSDTVLPQTYTGGSFIDYVGALQIPAGAGTITYDLTRSTLGTYLQNGTATALILGPASTPTFDAYNAAAGAEFYCSIFGPGAYDTFGNAEYPYLTIVLQKTNTVQQGSNGAGGGILITAVDNADTPVAFIEPFAGTDGSGNQYAQGFTGQISNWNPSNNTPGSFTVEGWHSLSVPTGMTGNLRYKMLAEFGLVMIDVNLQITSTLTSGNAYTSSGTLPTAYCPTVVTGSMREFSLSAQNQWSTVANGSPRLQVTTSGGVTVQAPGFVTSGSTCRMQGFAIYPVN